ncbi:hypothetical protein NLX83_16110 [Allokutzneria sp. A3M-2-11 16]|uniref:hypothetical protein n=1 Tax=Allokutzneria sp. A3M-2-11 16 TaxID=2962043 RepID=UPI0020B87BEE|nr:hypothetical protein [Allokutzneria sp. A3M-2-11 16]MCP3800791.1 hypothetical protein [Allokutzneria sp. A3M-2-11 16]
MITTDAETARLHRKTETHWVMRVGEQLEFRIEHDPDVAPPMWALRDTLLCHGFHPYPSDLRAWELAPETTRIRVVRDLDSLPRSERPVAHRSGQPSLSRNRSTRTARSRRW